MHSHRKSAVAAPFGPAGPGLGAQEAEGVALDQSMEQTLPSPARKSLSHDDGPSEEGAGRRRAPGGSMGFYNLVKACAKDDPAAGATNLEAHVAQSGRDIDGTNAKGSTGLHACGYLKRWDLAQVLLGAGADPLCKNAAGHSFFLTAVRDAGAPWEKLLERHPELTERHRVFLAKETGRLRQDSGKRGERPQPTGKQRSLADGKAALPPGPREGRREDSGFEQSLAAFIDAGDWRGASHLLDGGAANLTGFQFSADRIIRLAQSAPPAVLELLCTAAFPFTPESVLRLARRAVAEGWEEKFWMRLGRAVPPASQEELLNSALRDKKIELVSSMAQQGWRFGEDFIENCEEAGYLDLADELIDLKSALRDLAPAAQAVKPKKRSGSGDQGAQARKSHAKNGMGQKKARPSGGGGGARRSAMIANLDGPVREANEFEYKDRKPSAGTTIIIVKKARAIALGEI